MLLINLADPQWISIPCDKILLGNIFCLIEDRSSSNQSLIRMTPQLKSCSKEEVLKNGLCFRFIPEKMKSRNICAVDTRKIQFIFHTGNLIFPSLYTCDLKNIVTYTKYRDFLKTSVTPATFNNSKFALFVDSRSWQKLVVGGNIFKLRNNVYSSFMYIHINSDRESKKRSECPSLFYSTHSGKCKMFFDSLLNQKQYNLKVKRGDLEFACSKGFNINKLLVNDLVIDCEDETDEDLLPLGSTPTCMQIGQISCRNGHRKCLNISEICTYKLNDYNHLIACRTGEHLQNCTHFECNLMFKCLGYYCIPWGYVCDGKWDCPMGTDEMLVHKCGPNRQCSHLFKCTQSQVCLHLGNTCDGEADCPHGDDEELCLLSKVKCPIKCNCLVFAIKCFNLFINEDFFVKELPYYAIIFKSCKADLLKTLYHLHTSLLIFSYSNLTKFCKFLSNYLHLLHIDFSFNSISKVQANCFQKSQKAKIIKLNNNYLIRIRKYAFSDLVKLLILNLSHNPLSSLFIKEQISLNVLSLVDVNLRSVDKSQFQTLDLKIIQTRDYRLCCIVSLKTKCTTVLPWYISCTDLLPTKTIKITFYCISFLILFFNSTSVILQLKSVLKNVYKNTVFSITVISVNLTDSLCAIPIFILWVADLYYKGNFVLEEERWKSEVLCFLTFSINLHFSVSSPFVLSFMSFSRCMVVVHPFDSQFKEKNIILKYISMIFMVTSTLVIGLTTLTWYLYKNSPMGLFSPFIDPTNSFAVIKVLTWLTTIVQTSVIIIIIFTHIRLISSFTKHQKQLVNVVSKSQSNVSLIIQLLTITVSNVICWVPSSIIFVISMFMQTYPTEMLIWTSVAVVPINSIINPMVFITTTLRK